MIRDRGRPIASFARTTAANATAQALRLVASVVTLLVLLRRLDPVQYGGYTIGYTAMMFLAGTGSMGIPNGAAWLAARRPELLRATTLVTLALSGALGIAAAAAGMLLLPLLFPGSDAMALLGTPPALASTALVALLQGAGRFGHANAITTVQALLTLLAITAVVGPGATAAVALRAVVAALSLGALLAVALALWASRGSSPRIARDDVRALVSYGLRSHPGNTITLLVYRIDIFLIDRLAGREALGVYGAAVQVGEQLWLLSNAASSVLFARVAGRTSAPVPSTLLPSPLSAGAGAPDPLTARTCRVVCSLTALGALVVGVAAWVAPPSILPERYGAAALALAVLLPGIVATAGTRVLSTHLAAHGRLDVTLAIIVAALVVNVASNVVLIPRHGAVGAALASTIAYGVAMAAALRATARMEGRPLREYLVPTLADLTSLRRSLSAAPG